MLLNLFKYYMRFSNVIAPPSDSEDEDETAKRKRLELLIGGGNSEEDNSDEENGKEEMRVEWDVPKDDESDKMSGDEESGFKDELGRPMKRGEKKMTKYQLYLERRKLKRKERKAQELEAKKQRKEEVVSYNNFIENILFLWKMLISCISKIVF